MSGNRFNLREDAVSSPSQSRLGNFSICISMQMVQGKIRADSVTNFPFVLRDCRTDGDDLASTVRTRNDILLESNESKVLGSSEKVYFYLPHSICPVCNDEISVVQRNSMNLEENVCRCDRRNWSR